MCFILAHTVRPSDIRVLGAFGDSISVILILSPLKWKRRFTIIPSIATNFRVCTNPLSRTEPIDPVYNLPRCFMRARPEADSPLELENGLSAARPPVEVEYSGSSGMCSTQLLFRSLFSKELRCDFRSWKICLRHCTDFVTSFNRRLNRLSDFSLAIDIYSTKWRTKSN